MNHTHGQSTDEDLTTWAKDWIFHQIFRDRKTEPGLQRPCARRRRVPTETDPSSTQGKKRCMVFRIAFQLSRTPAILEIVDVQIWRYCPSAAVPAFIASAGVHASAVPCSQPRSLPVCKNALDEKSVHVWGFELMNSSSTPPRAHHMNWKECTCILFNKGKTEKIPSN